MEFKNKDEARKFFQNKEPELRKFVEFWETADSGVYAELTMEQQCSFYSKDQDSRRRKPPMYIYLLLEKNELTSDTLFMRITGAKMSYSVSDSETESGKKRSYNSPAGFRKFADMFETSAWRLCEAPQEKFLYDRLAVEGLPAYRGWNGSMLWLLENFEKLDWFSGKAPDVGSWIKKNRQIGIGDSRFIRKLLSVSPDMPAEEIAARLKPPREPYLVLEHLDRKQARRILE